MNDLTLYLIAAASAAMLVGSLWLLRRGPREPAPDARQARPAKSSKPPPQASPKSSPKALVVPLDEPDSDDDDPEVTIVRVQLDPTDFPDTALEDEAEEDEAPAPVAKTVSIVADQGAEEDEPTRTSAVILVSAAGQSDIGQRRKRNEDSFLRLDAHGVYAVADGMGGYAGGDIASGTAVDTMAAAFREGRFEGKIKGELPRRAEELARSVQMANVAIHEKARAEPHLEGMGTTLVAVRFALRKKRLYLAHVGDSRCYRVRAGQIRQLTTDHTLGNLGLTGPHAAYLSRAVGIKPEVTIDVIVGKPEVGDIYLLCSDGLTKMVKSDNEILGVIASHTNLDEAVGELVDLANERGGRDNVTVVLVAVRHPGALDEEG